MQALIGAWNTSNLIAFMKNARTFLALADALHFDQLDRIASYIEQFPKHRLVDRCPRFATSSNRNVGRRASRFFLCQFVGLQV